MTADDDNRMLKTSNEAITLQIPIMATVLVFYSYRPVYCAFLALICYYY